MYTTAETLIDKFGVQHLIYLTIKEPNGTETEPDLAAINREIGRVDGIIDGYLRSRYTLPLAEIPPELAGYAEDMTIARIYGCLPERTVPEDVTRAAKEAVAWLRDIQKGLASLSLATLAPAPSGGEPGATGFFKTSKRSEDRLFSDSILDRFTGPR
ncbi:hypothetical protein GURASL_13590 [Geotalea uraniireducens]|uniref:DUF1320 domain-containing protein n=1 Tax=Geotalea uraniireducens TaxID=351604 RepID=A0ABM8EJ79_9BACT|nr:DUF1320 domain-containing protein [Geotalea uraniireducens]BDV42436.1 hypothetical protein GURASL_13590 [Geotalea uraniireducens]